MIIVFLSAILVIFSGQLFFLNYSFQGLNRAIIATPIELMFNTVKYEGDDVRFNKSAFEEMILNYYENTLTRYAKTYEVDFYYYDSNDYSMCISDSCSSVEITIDCKLMQSYDYHRVMYYELVRN